MARAAAARHARIRAWLSVRQYHTELYGFGR